MVGDNGEILKAVNAGVAWTRQKSGVSVKLTSVRFVNADVGYVLGDENTVLRTGDGGANWKASTKPAEAIGLPLLYYDTSNLVLARSQGGSPNAFASMDGGQTWRTLNYPLIDVSKGKILWSLRDGQLYRSADFGLTETRVLDLRPADGTGAYRVQLLDDEGVLVQRITTTFVNGQFVRTADWLRSRDSGANWQAVTPQGLTASQQLSNLLASNTGSTLFISGYRSADAGDTWSPINWIFTEVPTRLSASVLLVKPQLRNAVMSADNGNTWAEINLPVQARLDHSDYSISTAQHFEPGRIVVHVSGWSYGSVESDIGVPPTLATFVSTDLGFHWEALDLQRYGGQYCARPQPLQAFTALDARRQLRVENGALKLSTDGGKTWDVKLTGLYPVGYCNFGVSLQFLSDKVGWVGSGAGRYRTANGGDTWTADPIDPDLTILQFIDDRVFWAERPSADRSYISLVQSQDGGKTWIEQGRPPADAFNLRFQSASRGIAFGSGKIYETRDGGKTWVQRYASTNPSTFRSNVVYADANTLWAVGFAGQALQSTDGGETWTEKVVDAAVFLTAVQFLDAQHGWIGGYQGELLATVDGGKTWKRQVTGTIQPIEGVNFLDAKTGWLSDYYGALLMTGTGGF